MKKIIIAGSLLIAAGVAHAGLLDAVTDTAAAVTSAKDSGVSADKAVEAILKSKFQENVTTKAQVKQKLGEPKATATEGSQDVWTYDMDSVNSKLSAATGIAKALGSDTSKVEKVVQLKFEGDVMKSYAVVNAAG
jgi:outer membrane protein assembly factor BamE (lipoprotein component of BamABCDE complex)